MAWSYASPSRASWQKWKNGRAHELTWMQKSACMEREKREYQQQRGQLQHGAQRRRGGGFGQPSRFAPLASETHNQNGRRQAGGRWSAQPLQARCLTCGTAIRKPGETACFKCGSTSLHHVPPENRRTQQQQQRQQLPDTRRVGGQTTNRRSPPTTLASAHGGTAPPAGSAPHSDADGVKQLLQGLQVFLGMAQGVALPPEMQQQAASLTQAATTIQAVVTPADERPPPQYIQRAAKAERNVHRFEKKIEARNEFIRQQQNLLMWEEKRLRKWQVCLELAKAGQDDRDVHTSDEEAEEEDMDADEEDNFEAASSANVNPAPSPFLDQAAPVTALSPFVVGGTNSFVHGGPSPFWNAMHGVIAETQQQQQQQQAAAAAQHQLQQQQEAALQQQQAAQVAMQQQLAAQNVQQQQDAAQQLRQQQHHQQQLMQQQAEIQQQLAAQAGL